MYVCISLHNYLPSNIHFEYTKHKTYSSVAKTQNVSSSKNPVLASGLIHIMETLKSASHHQCPSADRYSRTLHCGFEHELLCFDDRRARQRKRRVANRVCVLYSLNSNQHHMLGFLLTSDTQTTRRTKKTYILGNYSRNSCKSVIHDNS